MRAFLSKKEKGAVRCLACAHSCLISEGSRGICSVRKNKGGELFLEAYGCAASFGVDFVEKKPLYHYLPGSKTFSFGTLGCNFRCVFCQNFDISMPLSFNFEKNLSPKRAVFLALQNDCKSISYTYNEPAVFAEYALDTARLARDAGLKNILISNGFFSNNALDHFVEVIDAVNIDLKSFSDDFYKKHCGGSLNPVLESIKRFVREKVWVEVTTLVIPNLNDSKENFEAIAKFIASIDKNIPWHISRFYPAHKLKDVDFTSVESLELAKKIGLEAGLKNIYIGNVPYGNNTYCDNCGSVLIRREHNVAVFVREKCSCGKTLGGVFI